MDSRSVQEVPKASTATVSSYPGTAAFLWLAEGPEGSAEGISFFDDLANRDCLYFLYSILLSWRYIPKGSGMISYIMAKFEYNESKYNE